MSTTRRARSVLGIRPFRRLWAVTYLCSVADWLAMLGLTGLVTKYTDDYLLQNFAFVGVVLTQLLPGLLFAPLGGLLADRFDRRKVMICADLARFALLFSIPIVGSPIWLFVANFMAGSAAMMWIPSKDAAVPNLLRRPDQVETANQLGLFMTYGLAVVSGAGLYSVLTGVQTTLGISPDAFGEFGVANAVVFINAVLYLASAILIATRIPELSLRNVHPVPESTAASRDDAASRSGESGEADEDKVGFIAMVRQSFSYIRRTKLVRGLLIGMMGAFAAGGAVIGAAKPYSSSLGGGDASFGLLFVAVFVGAATGLAMVPKLARRLPHDRLFGVGIVLAGMALIVVALSPHLAVSLIAAAAVGGCAGAGFLTGVTIIGSQIDDAMRGRINAIYQSLLKIIIFGSTAMVPVLIGLVQPHKVTVWGNELIIDGTRPVLLGGGLLAALVGVVAYRQMDSRRTEPMLADLRNIMRRRPRRVNGLLIALEGTAATDTGTQAARLADALRTGERDVVFATDPALDDARLQGIVSGASLSSARAQALAAAAVRADIVERDIRPALDSGAVVVMERFVDSPLAHLAAVAGLDASELEGLADWATARLRPDLAVLLDTEPEGGAAEGGAGGASAGPHHWRVQQLLTEMASADPQHYVVVDADGSPDEVAGRIHTAVQCSLAGKVPGLAKRGRPKAGRGSDVPGDDAESQDRETHDAESQDGGSQDGGVGDSGVGDSGTRDTASQDTASQDGDTRDSETHDGDTREAGERATQGTAP
ncbi:bifunctional MFS transporter/dTMP kinase [Prauserella aidingensis]|uniref:bifunctional MFS transporter/dTMP kinase n=1 Tax=Prauserella aidingensis TaxID=387890 RepID=UPI0020A2D61C|nr:MFS transporter [Prauserella aidingensis]